jgi:hypothetical protein
MSAAPERARHAPRCALAQLRRAGLHIRLDGERILVRQPYSVATDALIRANRDRIARALRDERAGLAEITAQFERVNCVRCLGDGCRHCGNSGRLTLRGEYPRAFVTPDSLKD